jgi:hypothetical protein
MPERFEITQLSQIRNFNDPSEVLTFNILCYNFIYDLYKNVQDGKYYG